MCLASRSEATGTDSVTNTAPRSAPEFRYRPAMAVGTDLARLEALVRSFGPETAREKLALLHRLDSGSFPSAKMLSRFHEAALVARVHPDDDAIASAATGILDRFHARADLRRHRAELVDSGIAGTDIRYPFHWVTARFLAQHWPERLRVDWASLDDGAELERVMPRLLGWVEAVEPGMQRAELRRWLESLASAREPLGTFLVRRFERLRTDESVREHVFEGLGLPLVLRGGPGGPCRGSWALPGAPEARFGAAPARTRPDLRAAVAIAPKSVRWLRGTEATAAIDLARVTMLTRGRDLDAIKYGNPADVRLVDAGDGLSFLCIGIVPEQRPTFETVYVFLVLQNGIPIGYYQAALLFGGAELNFNVFPTFRGATTAAVYARGLAMVRHLFAVDTFAVPPYQIGHENEEALASGAFWFYAKLGFRPHDPAIAELLREEEAAMQRDPKHRSSRAVLRRLARGYVYFHLGRPHADVAGRVSFSAIARHISDVMTSRFGSDRERGLRELDRWARPHLGVRRLNAGEELAWKRWLPLVATLPDIERWSRTDLRALAEVIRAKGAPVEERHAELLRDHRRLRRALVALAR